jgi:hypothetical protein
LAEEADEFLVISIATARTIFSYGGRRTPLLAFELLNRLRFRNSWLKATMLWVIERRRHACRTGIQGLPIGSLPAATGRKMRLTGASALRLKNGLDDSVTALGAARRNQGCLTGCKRFKDLKARTGARDSHFVRIVIGRMTQILE